MLTYADVCRLWVKFGYDPSLDREAYKYQMIDFRVAVKHVSS